MKIVITGGPGFGKTTIINELRNRGYWGGRELFDEFILDQLKTGGDLLPWNDHNKFEAAMLPRKLEEYVAAPTDVHAFFDRGFPDHIGFAAAYGLPLLPDWLDAIKRYRYEAVFLVPPWRGIWRQDQVRREPWGLAVDIHNHIAQAYRECGYKPIDIPHCPVSERAAFVLRHLPTVRKLD